MGSVKYKEAYKAASTLEESLNGFVPLKICEFDMSGGKVNHYVVKDFNDKKGGNASWTYFNHNYSKSGNMDGYNIRVALQELKQRKERKKVLIILSDGQPCGDYVYYGSLAMADVKNAIREGRKDGIHIFNIMFGSESNRKSMLNDFKYMYEKGIVSCEPEMIGDQLLRIVKRELA